IAAIGPFVRAMEAAARRQCVAVLMERQPSSIADVCWPPVWGESRVPLPALPEFVELLRAFGREPAIERLERSPIEKVIVTNTIPCPANRSQKIVVLSVARLLGQAIRSIHEETSVSSLFV
ncbi:MAG: hypothetical protein EHM24_32910, partial [Acidobacteria bacterium]